MEDPRARATAFTLRGDVHCVPDMWLAGRMEAYARASEAPRDAMVLALEDWADHCELERRMESDRTAA